MAIKEATMVNGEVIKREFVGLSSDSKPTANVPVLSLFLESDTGYVYYFSGTAWVKS